MKEYLSQDYLTVGLLILIFIAGIVYCTKGLYKLGQCLTYALLTKHVKGIYWVKSPMGLLRFKKPSTVAEYESLLDVVHQLDLRLVHEGELKGVALKMHQELGQFLDDAPFEYRNGRVEAC